MGETQQPLNLSIVGAFIIRSGILGSFYSILFLRNPNGTILAVI